MLEELYVKLSPLTKKSNMKLFIAEKNMNKNILLFDSEDSKMAHCININGGDLLIGLNNFYEINSLELNLPSKFWKNSEETFFQIKGTHNYKIIFLNLGTEKERTISLELDMSVYVNCKERTVRILLGNQTRQGNWVQISEDCVVEITDNYLSGLIFIGVQNLPN